MAAAVVFAVPGRWFSRKPYGVSFQQGLRLTSCLVNKMTVLVPTSRVIGQIKQRSVTLRCLSSWLSVSEDNFQGQIDLINMGSCLLE